ncbi:MAG TPA: hypothetical protein VM573_03915, partial [Actinomycetota bacterium]|nr:hypothetical protein [Actinomycetota bacterium]
GAEGVWVGNFGSHAVSHVDPRLLEVAGGTRVGGPIGGVAVGAGYVWVTEQEAGRLIAIDPRTEEVAGHVAVGPVPQGVAVGPDGEVWVVVQGDGAVARVELR